MKTVEPGDDRWHDKSLDGKSFTCEHCGAKGTAWEADALCDECGKITKIPIEVPEEGEWGP